MITTILDSLLIGVPQPFKVDGELSAIKKTPVSDKIWLGAMGLEGNQVADPVHHGGLDKAVHLYPADHYDFWRQRYPDLELLDQPGAFGENFSCSGLTEDRLCLGDRFRVGDALIACSHARQPCWKLNHYFGHKDVMKTVVQTAKSGSYFRVLEPGSVRAGDQMIQCEQPLPEWPLDRLFMMLIGGKHKGQGAELCFLAETELLAETWRTRAANLANSA
ncbi:MOSC domain-containing protein [Parasphingorhabdus sp.]|uniref:MOSC domain-containing protein n=1 Tax=Parasphingorhabdus sp. TaxID=2709688 RepID=UPI0032661535